MTHATPQGRTLLSISTVAPVRDTVAIDGTDHPILLLADLGALAVRRLTRLLGRIETFGALPIPDGDAPTESAEEAVEAALESATQTALDINGALVRLLVPSIPDEVLARLKLDQRQAIVHCWVDSQTAANGAAPEGEAAPEATSAPTPAPAG